MLRHPSNRVRHLRTGNRKHISLRSPNDTGSVGRGRHVTGTRHSSICFSFVSRQKVWPVKGGSLAPSKWDTLFFYYFREIRMISIASQSDNSQNLETKECKVNNLLIFYYKTMEKKTWKTIIQVLISVLTAALGTTGCMKLI